MIVGKASEGIIYSRSESHAVLVFFMFSSDYSDFEARFLRFWT
jgi:hypothetical protein